MQKFDTPAPISAVLDIPAGRVRFIAAERGDTTVRVRPVDDSRGRDVKAARLGILLATRDDGAECWAVTRIPPEAALLYCEGCMTDYVLLEEGGAALTEALIKEIQEGTR